MSETPRENLVAMSNYLKLANRDLQDSLKLTSKPIMSLLHLLNSSMYSGDKENSVLWLNYANRIDAGNYGVRRRYLLTLAPRWGGSYEQMWTYLDVCRGQHMSDEYLRIFESNIYLDQVQTFAERNQHDRALLLYRKALSLLDGIDNADRLKALTGVVYSRRNSQSLEAFLPEIEEVLRLNPTERQILGYRGWIRLKQQRVREGLEDYAKAAELGDPYSQARRGIQLYYGVQPFLSSDREQGLVWLRKAADQGEEHAQQFLKQVGQMP